MVCAGTVNKAGDTPLSLACGNGHLDTIKYLVNEHHCDPRSKRCIWHINCCITQYICTCIDTVNKAGDTPLYLAYKGGHWEVVKYLAITHHCDTTSKSVCSWLGLGENGGDRKKICVTSNISGTKVFLDTFFVSKDRKFINNKP